MLPSMTNSAPPPYVPVEPILIENLLLLGETLAAHRGCKLATISRAASKDPPFFDNIKSKGSTVSSRKYDECMVYFITVWPDDLPWPANGGVKPSLPGVKAKPVRAAAAGRRAIRKTKK